MSLLLFVFNRRLVSLVVVVMSPFNRPSSPSVSLRGREGVSTNIDTGDVPVGLGSSEVVPLFLNACSVVDAVVGWATRLLSFFLVTASVATGPVSLLAPLRWDCICTTLVVLVERSYGGLERDVHSTMVDLDEKFEPRRSKLAVGSILANII